MAPPKVPGASKKQKTGGSTSRQPRPFDSNHFNAEHTERYKELEKRKIWSEKQFNINREGTYREVAHVFESKRWDGLVSPPEYMNYNLVREFYTNTLPNDGEAFTCTTFVRGRGLRFDRDAINEVLGNPHFGSVVPQNLSSLFAIIRSLVLGSST